MRQRKNTQGFTLMEMVVALGIFSLLVGSIASILMHSVRYNAILWEELSTQHDGRRVLQKISSIVRRAEASSVGSFPVAIAGNYELAVYANIDTDSARERVRFFLDGTNLKQGVIEPSGNPLSYPTSTEAVTLLAEDVVNQAKNTPIFNYFNESYTGTQAALTQPVASSAVHVIRVQLELEEDPNQTPVPLHVETTVHIRNLKTN